MRRPGRPSQRQRPGGAWDLGFAQRSNVVEVYVRYLRDEDRTGVACARSRPCAAPDTGCARTAREAGADPRPAHRRVRGRHGRARRQRRVRLPPARERPGRERERGPRRAGRRRPRRGHARGGHARRARSSRGADGGVRGSAGGLRGAALTRDELRRGGRRPGRSRGRAPGRGRRGRPCVLAPSDGGGDRVVAVGASLDDRDETLATWWRRSRSAGRSPSCSRRCSATPSRPPACAPVEAMRRRAQYSPRGPHERLPLPVAHDEIRRLETLNAMLDRLRRALRVLSSPTRATSRARRWR